jgi:sugar phosphate isomerase/epimerase
MTRLIGFSTGALAKSDFRSALRLIRQHDVNAVELSALRDTELVPLLTALDDLDLTFASYCSFHAPSRFETHTEAAVADMLRRLLPRRWPIIVHPDALQHSAAWHEFGAWLCIENMDNRKPVGRTEAELRAIFERFPEASLCFDIGHARQVDPTMAEAARILRSFGERLKQVHLSEVNADGSHDPMSAEALSDFRKVADLIPTRVPIILETDVAAEMIDRQVELARGVFGRDL